MKTSTQLNNQAIHLLFAGEIDSAEEQLRRCIREDTENTSALNNLAFLLQHKGELAEAKSLLEKSIQIKPSTTAHLNLGNVLYELSEPEAGVSHIVESLNLNTRNARAWESLALICMAQGNFPSACDCWDKVLLLEPDSPSHHIQFAVSKMAMKSFDAARISLGRAIEYEPANAFAWYQLGLLHFLQSNFGAAKQALVQCLSITPSDSKCRYHLALVHLALHDVAEAKRQFDSILVLEPTNAKILTERGVLEISSSREAALTFFKKALSADPGLDRAKSYLDQLQESRDY